jgi:predicted nucleic acid-binding Zn ribbon protein
MATYEYICKSCGSRTSLDRLPSEGADMRHLVEGEVCGTFRRDWSSVSIDLSNCRAVPRGNRRGR